MPKPYPKEFRDDVVSVARNREPGQHLKQIAADFGISESCLTNWMKAADVEEGVKPGTTSGGERRPARGPQADPAARAGERGSAPSGGLPISGEPAGKMIYPLVRELAVDGIPVAVTCRVLKIARQPYYRWLAAPVTTSDLVRAYRANALFDAHRDDPEFGYRFLVDEAAAVGQPMATRTAWAICAANRWWSAFGKPRRGKGARPGPPVHDDRVNRVFAASAPNQLWLTDIERHEALPNRAVVEGHRGRSVAAGR